MPDAAAYKPPPAADADDDDNEDNDVRSGNLMHLTLCQPVNIEFHDLCYSVPQGGKGGKCLLHGISGQFKAGQLTAIMGPSGAGKSTILNILAAYKVDGTTGNILVNGEPRNERNFRKISRYIMQEDAIQPLLTVNELMTFAANLKLGTGISKHEKQSIVDEILAVLRMTKTKNTRTERLSGGERKRLSIALELLNNPPVIFLDEPTTGLDDVASFQCIKTLKMLAKGGRTIICSIHTPSSRMFSMFDNIYVLSEGYCTYQGCSLDIVSYLSNIGLPCPITYNPADFIIEVCTGAYGDHHERLVKESDNGRGIDYYKRNIIENELTQDVKTDELEQKNPYRNNLVVENKHRSNTSSWTQFRVLLFKMWLQTFRDKNYLALKLSLTIIIGLIIGNLFLDMGKDGSKTLFVFGFYYTCIIKYLYIPMMPVLLYFPTEMQMLKRESFNKWYKLTPYFFALTISTIPLTFALGMLYTVMVLYFTGQDMNFNSVLEFYMLCMMTALVSESLGLLVSAHLNLVNANFVGPVVAVPLMLFAVYGLGYGAEPIPMYMEILIHFSYLRYSLVGIVTAMTQHQGVLPCPPEEEICVFNHWKDVIFFMGLEYRPFWINFTALCIMFILFRVACFMLIKQRLRPGKLFQMIRHLMRNLKMQFNIPF